MASNPIRTPEFNLEIDKQESEATVRVIGRITSASSPNLASTVRDLA